MNDRDQLTKYVSGVFFAVKLGFLAGSVLFLLLGLSEIINTRHTGVNIHISGEAVIAGLATLGCILSYFFVRYIESLVRNSM